MELPTGEENTMKRRINIEITDGKLTEAEALTYVQNVVAGGRISTIRDLRCFCAHTEYENGVHVVATANSLFSDSFKLFKWEPRKT